MPEQKAKPTYRSGRGGVVLTQHSDRTMKAYTVCDGELSTLSMLSTLTTICFSIAGTCITTAFGLWSGIFIEGSPSETAKNVVPVLVWGFGAVGLVFGSIGLWVTRHKNSEIDRIKRESSN